MQKLSYFLFYGEYFFFFFKCISKLKFIWIFVLVCIVFSLKNMVQLPKNIMFMNNKKTFNYLYI